MRRSIDDAQPNPLARSEEARPVVVRAKAIDEEGVGRPRNIRNIGRVHAHLAPFHPILEAHLAAGEQPAQRRALIVEIGAAHLLELAENFLARHFAMVGEDDHMLAVERDRVGTGRINHDGSVEPCLLLLARMAVIPVGARLQDREFVYEGRTRLDAREADAGHAVHLERQNEPVPVNRAILVEIVGHCETDVLALLEADERCGHGAVDADCRRRDPVHDELHPVDRQRDVCARHGRQGPGDAARHRLRPSRQVGRHGQRAAKHGGSAHYVAPV